MKLIKDDESVKFINLRESFAQEDSKTNFIDDNFYESKSASIFDDNFQGIEWPVVKKHRPDIHDPLDPVVGVVMSDLPGNIFNDD